MLVIACWGFFLSPSLSVIHLGFLQSNSYARAVHKHTCAGDLWCAVACSNSPWLLWCRCWKMLWQAAGWYHRPVASWPLWVLQEAELPWGLQQGWTQRTPWPESCSSAVCLVCCPSWVTSILKTSLSWSDPAGEGFIRPCALTKLRQLSGKLFCRATATWDLRRSR